MNIHIICFYSVYVNPFALIWNPDYKAQAGIYTIPRSDAELDMASQMVGRALFLRCLCAENNLTFDAQGRVNGSVKKTGWTLSGMNVLKVSRKGANQIELDGVRVAVRYATDRHEFDRKPQND